MAFISPRLGVLNNIPFAIPFNVRVEIFRQFIANDAHRLGFNDDHLRPKHRATIRRNNVAQDGFDQLGSLGAGLKEKVSITFIDDFGNEEAGIDGGTHVRCCNRLIVNVYNISAFRWCLQGILDFVNRSVSHKS